MTLYLLKRFFEMIPTLLGITIISFFIIHLAPGKPTDVLTEMNPKITPEAREKLEKYYGLDNPLYVQYKLWIERIVRFDFGESFSTDRRPVIEKIWDKKQPLQSVLLPYVDVGRHCRLANVVVDAGVRIPPGLVVGEDPELDARRFRRTDRGICLITQPMIERLGT